MQTDTPIIGCGLDDDGSDVTDYLPGLRNLARRAVVVPHAALGNRTNHGCHCREDDSAGAVGRVPNFADADEKVITP